MDRWKLTEEDGVETYRETEYGACNLSVVVRRAERVQEAGVSTDESRQEIVGESNTEAGVAVQEI